MDEPTLQVRDGAQVWLIPLTQLLVMVDAARDIAEGAITLRDKDAVAAAEAGMRQPNRGRAGVSAYLLQHYMGKANARAQDRTVVAPAQSVAGEAAAAAPAAPAAPLAGPCQHPPDVACPACAGAHQEARNAKKRAGARA